MTIEWAETNPAKLIRRANLASMGKRVPESDTWKPSLALCKSMVLAEDSTIELASLIIDDDIRGDVAGHLVRHTAYHPRHIVQSAREDWTGKPRPGPEALRIYLGKWSIKALISMSRQRLCYRAMKETREEVEAIKRYLINSDDVLMQAVGWGLVTECVYRANCTAGKRSCHWFDSDWSDGWSSIEERYDEYNKWFVEHKT